MREPNVFGPLMVKMKAADAFVSGLTYDYPEVIRPALQIHHTRPGVARAAGVYLMIIEDRVYLFTDATVNIDPTARGPGGDRRAGGGFRHATGDRAAGGIPLVLELRLDAAPAVGEGPQGGADC